MPPMLTSWSNFHTKYISNMHIHCPGLTLYLLSMHTHIHTSTPICKKKIIWEERYCDMYFLAYVFVFLAYPTQLRAWRPMIHAKFDHWGDMLPPLNFVTNKVPLFLCAEKCCPSWDWTQNLLFTGWMLFQLSCWDSWEFSAHDALIFCWSEN